MVELCWLHLSDLHFRRGGIRPFHNALIDDIIGQLTEHGFKSLDAIFISGDVAWSGNSKEYKNASRFLKKMFAALGDEGISLDREHVFVVPGNHDFDWENKKKPFEAFRVFGKDEKLRCSPPWGAFWPLETGSAALKIIGLNTARLSDGTADDKGRLRVSLRPFSRLDSLKQGEIRILLLHHPMCFLEETHEKRLREYVRRYKVAFILRGHTHKSDLEFKVDPAATSTELVTGAAFTRKRVGTGYILFRMDVDKERCQAYFRQYEGSVGWTDDSRLRQASNKRIARYGYREWVYLDPSRPRDLLQSEFAGDTHICWPSRPTGSIFYRGVTVEEILEKNTTYPEVIHLLSTGRFPNEQECATVLRSLEEGYGAPWSSTFSNFTPEDTKNAKTLFTKAWLRLMSYLPTVFRPEEENRLKDAFEGIREDKILDAACLVCGRFTALVCKLISQSGVNLFSGLLPRDSPYRHAEFLLKAADCRADKWATQLLDRVLVLFADHGCATSTYAGRVTSSAHSHPIMSLVAAACAFGGDRHGAAAIDIIETLQGISTPGRAKEVLERFKRRREIIPGFGHALKPPSKQALLAKELTDVILRKKRGQEPLCKIAIACDETAAEIRKWHPEFLQQPNALLYLAPLLRDLGFRKHMVPLVLASSRVIGWFLHAQEAYADRIIRPRLRFVGKRFPR